MELTHSLESDFVRHLAPKAPLVTSPTATVRETIRLLQENQAGCVIICDGQNKAIGIFTERDVLRRVIGKRVDLDSPITDVMTTDLASVRESDKIARAIHLLHERGLRHLPVLDDEGVPIGLITVRRVMEYLVEHFPQTIYNLPPDPSTILEAREGA
ncbi:MAG: CBS domain-containing protein [Planctomycetes bacterium]|nr:CBS domain-containing protein [Planctomycetota bacterium]